MMRERVRCASGVCRRDMSTPRARANDDDDDDDGCAGCAGCGLRVATVRDDGVCMMMMICMYASARMTMTISARLRAR